MSILRGETENLRLEPCWFVYGEEAQNRKSVDGFREPKKSGLSNTYLEFLRVPKTADDYQLFLETGSGRAK